MLRLFLIFCALTATEGKARVTAESVKQEALVDIEQQVGGTGNRSKESAYSKAKDAVEKEKDDLNRKAEDADRDSRDSSLSESQRRDAADRQAAYRKAARVLRDVQLTLSEVKDSDTSIAPLIVYQHLTSHGQALFAQGDTINDPRTTTFKVQLIHPTTQQPYTKSFTPKEVFLSTDDVLLYLLQEMINLESSCRRGSDCTYNYKNLVTQVMGYLHKEDPTRAVLQEILNQMNNPSLTDPLPLREIFDYFKNHDTKPSASDFASYRAQQWRALIDSRHSGAIRNARFTTPEGEDIESVGDTSMPHKKHVRIYFEQIRPALLSCTAGRAECFQQMMEYYDQAMSQLGGTSSSGYSSSYSGGYGSNYTSSYGSDYYTDSYSYGSSGGKNEVNSINSAIRTMLQNLKNTIKYAFDNDKFPTQYLLYAAMSSTGQSNYVSGVRVNDPMLAKLQEKKEGLNTLSALTSLFTSLLGGEPKKPDIQKNVPIGRQIQARKPTIRDAFFDPDDVLNFALQQIESNHLSCGTWLACVNRDRQTIASIHDRLNPNDPARDPLKDVYAQIDSNQDTIMPPMDIILNDFQRGGMVSISRKYPSSYAQQWTTVHNMALKQKQKRRDPDIVGGYGFPTKLGSSNRTISTSDVTSIFSGILGK